MSEYVYLRDGVCVRVGLLADMKGLVVTAVALGKAHGVLLTDAGHVFTFGPNNKGQCGRGLSQCGRGLTSSAKQRAYRTGLSQSHFSFMLMGTVWSLGLGANHFFSLPFPSP